MVDGTRYAVPLEKGWECDSWFAIHLIKEEVLNASGDYLPNLVRFIGVVESSDSQPSFQQTHASFANFKLFPLSSSFHGVLKKNNSGDIGSATTNMPELSFKTFFRRTSNCLQRNTADARNVHEQALQGTTDILAGRRHRF